jgi:ABC-type transport system involved in cytochrome bd biosynthesis fused ATPase/permease subunit
MRLADDCTALIITHRRELAEQCDYVVCMQKGQVVEQGLKADLVDKGSVFLEHFVSLESQQVQGG